MVNAFAICAALLPALCPAPAIADTIRVATFHVTDLSGGRSSTERLDLLAEVAGAYDLLALQGVTDEPGLNELLSALLAKGDAFAGVPRPVPPGEDATEMAFIWRTDAVALIDSGGTYADTANDFRHAPHYAAFRSGDFDVVLINISVPDDGAVADRAIESGRSLAVRDWVTDEYYGEEDVLLLGSVSVTPVELVYQGRVRSPNLPMLWNRWGEEPPTSTLVDSAASVDNIWLCCQHEFTGESGVDTSTSIAVSRHRPVWAGFSTVAGDDDNLTLVLPEQERSAWQNVKVSFGPTSEDVELADLDEDGRPELLVANARPAAVRVYEYGFHGFELAADLPLPITPVRVAAADLDGDEDLDVLVAGAEDDSMVVLMNEDGHLLFSALIDTSYRRRGFVLADLDGRAGAELATVNGPERKIVLFRWVDMEPVPWLQIDLGDEPVRAGEIWGGDLDGDGDGDLVLVHTPRQPNSTSGYELVTVRGADAGSSWEVVRYPALRGARAVLEVGDVSGDGIADVVVARDPTAWVATEPGVFTGPTLEPTHHRDGDMCGADFDGDGLMDVALVDWEGRIDGWSSTGTGEFTQLIDLPFGDRFTRPSITCGDVEEDGDPDIVVADAVGGRVVLYHNPLQLRSDAAPWANAGQGGWIVGGAQVRLDGSHSSDADGDSLQFEWTQVSGPPVDLQDATRAVATFRAPQVLDSLTFSLQVTDGEHSSRPDTVAMRVRPTEYAGILHEPPRATWAAMLRAPGPINAIAVSPIEPQRVYAGVFGHGVFRSTDGGVSWERSVTGIDTMQRSSRGFPNNYGVVSLAAHPADPDVAFLGTEGWSFRTLDGGATWEPMLIKGTHLHDMALAHDALYAGLHEGAGLMIGTETGESFVRAAGFPKNDITTSAAFRVGVDPFDRRIVYATAAPGDSYALHRTLNGKLWTNLWAPGSIPMEVSPVTGWIYVGDAGNYPLSRSRDLGETWEGTRRGLDGVSDVSAFAFDPAEPQVVYITTDKGVYWSGDGGVAWHHLDGPPRVGAPERFPRAVRPITLAAGQPQHLFVGADSTLYRATLSPSSSTAVTANSTIEPSQPRLLKRYPNPANGRIVLDYDTAGRGAAVIEVHDLLGQLVWRYDAPGEMPGPRSVTWDGRARGGYEVASGMYFVTLRCAGTVDRMRFVLLQ